MPVLAPTPTPTPNPQQALKSSLPWFSEDLSGAEESALSVLSEITGRGQSLGIAVAALPWVADGVDTDELEALQTLAYLAGEDASLAETAAGFPWFADGLTENERNGLTNIAVLAGRDISLGRTVMGFAWVADAIEEDEWASLGDLAVIAGNDVSLARAISNLPSLADGFSRDTRSAIYYLRTLAEEDAGLAAQLAAMPFIEDSIEEHDVYALISILDLTGDPEDLALLVEQSWFTDGVTDGEAVLVTVLGDQARIAPGEFRSLLAAYYLDSATVALPLAGDVALYILRLDPPSTIDTAQARSRQMTQLEEAVLLTEEFMGIPFPQSDVILLFGEPGIDTAGVYRGTHMTVSPPQRIQADFRRVIAHEVGHYYWGGGVSPLWFREGGADFLASYVVQQVYGDSLSGRLTDVEMSNRRCGSLGMSNIQQLIDNLALVGFTEQSGRTYFTCNYTNGELLFLNLYDVMGPGSFKAAWLELYELAGPERRPWTEEDIHAAFLRHTPSGAVSALEDIYARVHGGDFSR